MKINNSNLERFLSKLIEEEKEYYSTKEIEKIIKISKKVFRQFDEFKSSNMHKLYNIFNLKECLKNHYHSRSEKLNENL